MNKVFAANRATVWFMIVVFTAMSFCWSERLSSVGIILLLMHWFLDPSFFKKIKLFKWNAFILLSILFFSLHLLGLFRSTLWADGWQSVEVKLSFLILPILFNTEHYLDQHKRNWLLFFFTLSCCISFFYTAGMSYKHYHQLGLLNVLGRMNLSEAIMHPGYYSNYLVWALVWCILFLFREKDKSYLTHFLILITVFILTFAIVFLSSKTAILYLLLFMIYALWHFCAMLKSPFLRILIFLLSLGITAAIVYQVPTIKHRLAETRRDYKAIDKNVPASNSTGSRTIAWELGWKLMKKNILYGSGTGNANQLLNKEFIKEGYLQLANDNMHTHNQFLYTGINLGFMGLLLMLLLFIESGKRFYRKKDMQAFWLIPLILVNLATDDMLEIQAGSVFFIFFLSLFIFQKEEIGTNDG